MTHFPSIPSIVLISSISAISLPLLSQSYDMADSQRVLDRLIDMCRSNGGVFYYDSDVDGKIRSAFVRAQNDNPVVFDSLAYHFWSRPSWPGFWPALAANQGWPIEPRWCVVNKHGHVTFSSTVAPTEQEIIKQLKNADIQELSKLYKDFTKENPYREDALMKLFNRQYEIVKKRLKKYLVDNGFDQRPWPDPVLKRPLTYEEDEEVWADFAETLKLAVEKEAWSAITIDNNTLFDRTSYMQPGILMSFSPKMQTLATYLLPRVSQVVREYPENKMIWSLWIVLEKASGGSGSAILPLLASIEARPYATEDFPPEAVISRLLEYDVYYPEAEKYFKKLFEAHIKDPVDSLGERWEFSRIINTWRQVQTLINIYFKQNADGEADRILKTFVEWAEGNCAERLTQAVELAKQYNKAGLAADWERIDLENIKRNAVKNNEPKQSRSSMSWIVIDKDDGTDISDAFNNEITSYRLDSLPLPVKTGKRKDFPQFANLKPGWGLYNGKDFMFVYMENPPSYDLISGIAKRNGIVSKIEEYETFKKANDKNAHLEMELLKEYLQLAEKRMNRFNRSKPDKPMLAEEEDNIIWLPISRILEDFLSNTRFKVLASYMQSDTYVRLPEIPDSAAQSPIMKRMANKLIFTLEDMIRRDPAYPETYSLWSALNELADKKHSLLDTLSDLAPIPNEDLLFKDIRALGLLNREALKREEWDFIVQYSVPLWATWGYWWKEGMKRTDDEVRGILVPLTEALLAKNDVAEADRIFTEFMDSISSQTIQRRLVEIATKRNKPDLAMKWAAMRSKQ